jgi:hypothetical protein
VCWLKNDDILPPRNFVTILEIRRIENENTLAFGFYWHRKYRGLEDATKKRGEKNTD